MPDETPTNVAIYKASTDAASLAKQLVVATAMKIQGRRYVRVEGWQAIATAHGCVASSKDVEELANGVRAIGEVRRMSDGQLISQAEGFVGKDEPTWFGGGKYPKRADYAIRAMAQTRAISRACRSAFAYVVVLMDAGLQTTPAEEMGHDGDPGAIDVEPRQEAKPAEVVQQPAPEKTASAPANGAGDPKQTATQFLDEFEGALATIAVGDKDGCQALMNDVRVKKFEVWAKERPAHRDRLNKIRYDAIFRIYEQNLNQPGKASETSPT